MPICKGTHELRERIRRGLSENACLHCCAIKRLRIFDVAHGLCCRNKIKDELAFL